LTAWLTFVPAWLTARLVEPPPLRAGDRLSFADSTAATAVRLGAVLIHEDPEFNTVGSEVRQRMLPAKGAAGASTTI
jgi:hypothetical protein